MSAATPSPKAIPVAPSLDLETEPDILEQKNYPVNRRLFFLSLQAIFNAVIIGLVARVLVGLIDLITNISFYGKLSFAPSSPVGHNLGLFVIAVPVIGGLIVGVMARYGSAAIRGHGIPEAMEQVLMNESRIKPIITFLKPVSAAISIGTGGPFGAEGPIIATGGAFGSLTGQIMKVTANERKIMLAAGACAGMSAIFGTPLAGVLLAIELLLFEFSPRSIIPVALACATGAAIHYAIFGTEPVFAMPAIPEPGLLAMGVYVLLGALIGVFAAMVSKAVYLVEDLFEHLPVHWMWWPAIGAVVVGVVGFFAPRTLGVGYANITELLSGHASLQLLFILCFLKFISWVFSLGSGTSGGTLAPLLTIGGALGGLLGLLVLKLFPGAEINMATAVLIGMAAMFAGASRALLTSIVFALETTMQPHGMLPVLGACTAAYFVSFFLMKGSIMTEKIQRRGVQTPDAYEPDMLHKLSVSNVMETGPNVFSASNTIKEAREWIKDISSSQGQSTAFIVVNETGGLLGVIKREQLFSKQHDDNLHLASLLAGSPPYIYAENRLSLAVDIMSKHDIDLLPVVSHDKLKQVLGVISHKEIFTAYSRRRNEDEIFNSALLTRYQGIKIIARGKQIFRSR